MEADIFLTDKDGKTTEHLIVTPGIWIDGKTYWLRDSHEKLIPEEEISIRVKDSSIHSKSKIHDMFIKNHGNKLRNVKILFMHQNPCMTKELLTFVSPAEKAIFHIKNHFIYLVNGQCQGKPMDQMTVQPFWNFHTERIWQSPAKGILRYHPMAKGMMVSIFSLEASVPINEICKASTWTVFSHNKNELEQLNRQLKNTLAFPFKR